MRVFMGRFAAKILVSVFAVPGLVVLAALPLHSQDQPAARSLSVIEAVRSALEHNHEVRAQENALLAQGEDVGVARSLLFPRLTVEERASLTTNPGYAFFSRLNQERVTAMDFDPDRLNDPDRISDFQTSFTLEQPLFVRQAHLGLAMSRKEYQAKQAEFRRKREQIAYQVLKACCMETSARAFAHAARRGEDEAREHERVARLRYESGLAHYADVLRASTALSQARQRRSAAEKDLRLAQHYLGLLTSSAERIDISDPAPMLPLHEPSFYQDSARARSDLQAASLRSENAREGVTLAEAGYWPYLGVGGTYQFNDHDQPLGGEGRSWQVGAFLRWELFDGTRRTHERAKAAYLLEQARASLAAFRDGIDYRVLEAYANVQEARANIALARQALETAEEGARLMRLRYANGLASLADLLSSQAALEDARSGLVERENAAHTALATLSYESGTILSDLNIQD